MFYTILIFFYYIFQADDIIGQLIEAFKNLIKGMAGLKKNNTQFVAGNDKAKYPINFYNGQSMPWRVHIKDIPNQEVPKQRIQGNGKQNKQLN